jgi:hypothetical protein
VGTAKYSPAGALVGTNWLFYGGDSGPNLACNPVNIVTRINACGALVGSQTNVGQARTLLAGAPVGANGLFYGGSVYGVGSVNIVTRINACGALVGSQTNVGTARMYLTGAPVGSNGSFNGGSSSLVYGTLNNIFTRINACGAQVGCQTNIGSARTAPMGSGT